MKSEKILLVVSFILALFVIGVLAVQQMSQNVKFVGTVTDKKENIMTIDRLIFPDNDIKKATTVPQDLKITEATKFASRVLKDKDKVRLEYALSTPSSRASNPISFFTETASSFDSIAVGAKVAVTAKESAWPWNAPTALEIKVLPGSYNVNDPLGIPRVSQPKK